PVAPPPNTPSRLPEERDPEPSETSSARRWAGVLRFVHRGAALLSLVWLILPYELRELLINTVLG
ncbi:MAG: hypothetical protein ACRDTA_21415, partial [Pseudonocardiaceae bacterium]